MPKPVSAAPSIGGVVVRIAGQTIARAGSIRRPSVKESTNEREKHHIFLRPENAIGQGLWSITVRLSAPMSAA